MCLPKHALKLLEFVSSCANSVVYVEKEDIMPEPIRTDSLEPVRTDSLQVDMCLRHFNRLHFLGSLRFLCSRWLFVDLSLLLFAGEQVRGQSVIDPSCRPQLEHPLLAWGA